MARKSRIVTEKIEIEQAKEKTWNCGVYRRLSVEDGDREEFHSIGNQLKIAEDYVLNMPFLHICKVYTDNGISGMTYKRPGFEEMMEDLYRGVIDTVIVKDVSRLGRQFVLTSELVEKTFPSMNVRLICINDGFDSLKPDADVTKLLLPLKMLMNDNYARDFSKKIRSSINAKMDCGEFLPSSSSIPYGYVRNPKKKTFDVDEETAPVVRKIYDLREQGMAFHAIARVLNEEGIPSPGRIRYDRGLTNSAKFRDALWVRGAIRKIVSDPVYIGNRIHGKVKRDRLGEDKTRREKDEWLVIEDAHEAIVSKEQFERVQRVNEEALEKRAGYQSKPEVEDDQRELLQDKVYCGDCGSKMSARKGIGRISKFTPNPCYIYFDCNRYQDSGKLECKKHYIRQEAILKSLYKCLNEHFRSALDFEKFLEEVRAMPKVKKYLNEAQKSVVSLRTKKNNLSSKQEKLLSDYMEGLLDRQEYEYMKERIELQIMQIEREYFIAQRNAEELDMIGRTAQKWIGMLKDNKVFVKDQDIDRKLLDALVDKILVYDSRTIRFKMTFSDPFKPLREYVDKIEREERKHAG